MNDNLQKLKSEYDGAMSLPWGNPPSRRKVKAYVAALELELKGSYRWLPIETAPKNSTIIDVWSKSEGRLTSYWRVELSPDNVFYDSAISGVCCVRDVTHWMLPPESPIN